MNNIRWVYYLSENIKFLQYIKFTRSYMSQIIQNRLGTLLPCSSYIIMNIKRNKVYKNELYISILLSIIKYQNESNCLKCFLRLYFNIFKIKLLKRKINIFSEPYIIPQDFIKGMFLDLFYTKKKL